MLEKLQKLGLSNKEAQLYLALASSGEITANELAKKTVTQRTVTYNVLQQLVDKGIITYVNKTGRRFFSIAKPDALLAAVKEKETIANDLITQINKLKLEKTSAKKVEVYEGLEGMKSIFEEIRIAKELRILNATGKIFENMIHSAHHVVNDIILSSHPKVIATQSMKKTKMYSYKSMTVKFLPKSAENSATTFMFEGVIVIQVLKEKPFLIRIENQEIFDGYKKDFDILWDRL